LKQAPNIGHPRTTPRQGGPGTYAAFEANYTEEANYGMLMAIFENALPQRHDVKQISIA
jgi:hypothetical protein